MSELFTRLESELPALRIGEHLRVEELLGSGGMGDVFRAYDERFDRPVAVKFLRPSADGDDGPRALREARALARLSHPNIVRVFAVGEYEGQPYLVMELVEGPSLADARPADPVEALRTLREAVDAVAHAHDAGLIHRDLKPENVLTTATGAVKVTDFGLARRSDGVDWALTRPDRVAGTPHYLAPEALEGAIPEKTLDVYALGVLARVLLSGAPTGDLRDHSGAVRALVDRATAREPAERFADAVQMRDAIDRVLERGDAEPIPPEYASYAAAASLMGAVASAVVFWVLYISFTPEYVASDTVRPLVMLTSDAEREGRVLVLAQFRIGPTLLAAVAVAAMLGGYGWVRRYWRLNGLERPAPARPVASARTVLALGVFQSLAYTGRLFLLDGSPLAAFVPVLGGVVELVTLWFFWATLLEMQRTHRPWLQEWRLWVGLFFALIPPVADMAHHVARFLQA